MPDTRNRRLVAIALLLCLVAPLLIFWNQIAAFVLPGLHPGIRAVVLVLVMAVLTYLMVRLFVGTRDE